MTTGLESVGSVPILTNKTRVDRGRSRDQIFSDNQSQIWAWG